MFRIHTRVYEKPGKIFQINSKSVGAILRAMGPNEKPPNGEKRNRGYSGMPS